ncbi:ATPase%2Ctranscriptional regulator%2C luxR family [Mycobacterium tuberculosis]|nr:ATPase%2Ctranscriptional regulator%2C luxR family [Mycobacterium tuberculosis]
MLVDRKKVFAQFDELLAESAHGRGAIAAISGATAMGKTTLLRNLTKRAASSGSTVLDAVSSRDEHRVPFGVLGQLFHAVEPVLPEGGVAQEPATRADAGTAEVHDDLRAVARHAHRVLTRLAGQDHLLLTVDDVQHADIPSLWCLRYLAQRLDSLPVAFVFTSGALVDERPPPILHDLLYQPNVRRIHLEPLSPEAVAQLASGRSACAHSDRLAADVHALSAGNPLLVQALLAEHRFCGEPEPAQTRRAGDLPTGHIFEQAVLGCLYRLGPVAVRLARSIALLERSASPLLLSRLSGVDPQLVKRLVQTLASVGVLKSGRFRHDTVREAVLHEIPPAEGAELRHRAARLLHEDGAAPQVVARHLLDAGPLRENWVLEVLRDAVHPALVGNDVPLVLRYLELAAECCSDDAQRMAVKAQVAGIQWQLKPAESSRRFLSLKEPILSGKLTGDDKLKMAQGMLFNLDFDDALEVIDHVNTEDNEHSDLGVELRSTRLLLAAEFPGLVGRLARPLPTAEVTVTSQAELRSCYAQSLILERGADAYAVALAEQVLQSGQIRPPLMIKAVLPALTSLVYADRLETAADWCERLLADVGEHDAPAWRALIESSAALVALRRGRLAEAIGHAEAAFGTMHGEKWNVTSGLALALLVEAHTARGAHRAAARYLSLEMPPALFLTRSGLHYLYARGRHHLATGNGYMALSDFMECGKLMEAWRIDTPALVPWRLGAAEAWLRLDDRARATGLIEEQLAATDPDLTRSRGMLLHRLASVRATSKRPDLLQDALRLLEASGAWYEAARVLADLSGAYQDLGEKAKARTTARRARRIAKSCQADVMCLEPLPACSPEPADGGAASPAPAQAGCTTFAKLSDSERRVAVLTAQGYTNREIADRLFITVSTVEQHLTRVYRKMEIRNREQLLAGIHIDDSEAG